MTRKTYIDKETDCEIMVEEMSRKEALDYVKDFVDGIESCRDMNYSADMSIFILYRDGSFYSNIDGDVDGRLRKTNIKGIILDDGYEYYIYGTYAMSENMIPDII